MKTLLRAGVTLLCASAGLTTTASAWQPDNGNGTYTNPPLYADYPDPDIIRVGSDFYMVSTTFVNSPGINVLHSQDLVNWEIVSHVASVLDGGNAYNMVGSTAYRGGLWAPSIRYHNATFYVVVNPTFANARVYYTTNIAGPWQYYQLDRPAYDPGFFIDDDGTGYIFCGGGSQTVLKLSSDYSTVVSETDSVVASGGEGSHVVKYGGYYYLFNANPGVWPFQLLCSRATNIYGPYETGHVCLDETTGGHQGAIVDMPDGSWYGFVMRDTGQGIGRMTFISPVYWQNGWPVWGTSSAPNQVPATAAKPILGKPLMQPATSDEFSSSTLGLQWLWNHNPDNTRWSLTERSDYLRLHPTQAAGFWTARNTLTQKSQGPWSLADVKLDLSGLQPGDICGFGTLGVNSGHIFVKVDSSGAKSLNMEVVTDSGTAQTVDTRVTSVPLTVTTLYLRTDLDFQTGKALCSYSTDDANWTSLGGQYDLVWGWGGSGTFQGDQFSLFCYNPNTASSAGYVDIDWFHFTGGNIPNGTYRVLARHSGKGLDAYNFGTSDGSQIVQWPYWGGPNQQWTASYVGNGQYSILGVQSGKSIDINAWGTADGSKVQLWTYLGGTNQKFIFTPTDSSYYRITPSHAPNSCLDVTGISTDDGALIQLWTYWGGANQQWTFQAP